MSNIVNNAVLLLKTLNGLDEQINLVNNRIMLLAKQIDIANLELGKLLGEHDKALTKLDKYKLEV
jgi:hypothetical protein